MLGLEWLRVMFRSVSRWPCSWRSSRCRYRRACSACLVPPVRCDRVLHERFRKVTCSHRNAPPSRWPCGTRCPASCTSPHRCRARLLSALRYPRSRPVRLSATSLGRTCGVLAAWALRSRYWSVSVITRYMVRMEARYIPVIQQDGIHLAGYLSVNRSLSSSASSAACSAAVSAAACGARGPGDASPSAGSGLRWRCSVARAFPRRSHAPFTEVSGSSSVMAMSITCAASCLTPLSRRAVPRARALFPPLQALP